MASGRAWLLLSLDKDRQYAGNNGYADDLESVYQYDSFVPNHRQMAEGDFLIICNREIVLGTATLMRLESAEGTKDHLKCPQCGQMVSKERKVKRPRYRCQAKHEFDEPIRIQTPCTHYSARFGETFRRVAASAPIPVAEVRLACPRYNEQLAMQEVDRTLLVGAAAALVSEVVLDAAVGQRVLPEAAEDPGDTAGYAPTSRDERERVEREINARRGQEEFRKRLLKRFNDTCVITGCRLSVVLEAAHIVPYRGDKDHHPTNGLLLRADIHKLFDKDFLGIEPETLKVHLHRDVKSMGYEAWDGVVLACDARLLSKEALQARWKQFQLRA